MTEVIKEFWFLLAAVVSAVAWLIRLEARGITNAAEIRRLWAQRKEDMDAARDSRARVDHQLDEISTDVKTLLREVKR
jgi:hypothetical protein